MSNVGTGREPTAEDLFWHKFSQSFTPDKQIEALHSKAERVVGRTALVGTALGASGLVALSTILSVPEARAAAIVASSLAGLAILFALATQVSWNKTLRAGDLVELKKWFKRYSGWRGLLISTATLLLFAAFVSAVVAVAITLWEDRRAPTVSLSTTTVSTTQPETATTSETTTTSWSVSASATVPANDTSEFLVVELTSGSEVVGRVVQGVGADGLMTVALAAEGVPVDAELTLTATSRLWTCTLEIESDGEVACERRP